MRFLQGVAESLRPLLESCLKLRRSPRSPCCSPAAAGAAAARRPRRAGRGRGAPAVDRLLRRAALRDLAARRRAAPVRRRAGREDPRRARRQDARARRSWTSGDKRQRGGEQGLLSIAFAPDYALQRAVLRLLHRHRRQPARRRVQAPQRRSRRPGLGAPGAADAPTPEPNHNGGLLLFGPDGLLYIGTRRRRRRRRPARRARQRPGRSGTLLGKILRIDPRARGGAPVHGPAPTTRSWAARARSGEIYSYGLRNPWRFSFDRSTGDLTIGDVGQNEIEEIDFVRKGKAAGRTSAGARSRATTASPTASARPATIRPVITQQPLRRQLLDHRRRRHPRPGAAGLARALRLRRPLPRRAADRGARSGRRAQPDRPQAARSSSCPRSARMRAGGSTPPRSTGRSTGWCS